MNEKIIKKILIGITLLCIFTLAYVIFSHREDIDIFHKTVKSKELIENQDYITENDNGADIQDNFVITSHDIYKSLFPYGSNYSNYRMFDNNNYAVIKIDICDKVINKIEEYPIKNNTIDLAIKYTKVNTNCKEKIYKYYLLKVDKNINNVLVNITYY